MNKSLLLASLIAATALAACGKKEEAAPNTTVIVEPASAPTVVVEPASAPVVVVDPASAVASAASM